MLSAEILHRCFPKANKDNLNKYADALVAACEEFEINTPKRVAGFLSQVAHESAQFSAIKENLNYKSQALTGLFGSRITAAQAADVGHSAMHIPTISPTFPITILECGISNFINNPCSKSQTDNCPHDYKTHISCF